LFPGVQHFSKFHVEESGNAFKLEFSHRGTQQMKIHCQRSEKLEKGSIFKSLDHVSQFFKDGALGYSPKSDQNGFDGVKLVTKTWSVSPLKTLFVESQYFSNRERFPEGSVEFDNAILMENIEHEWVADR